MNPEIDLKPPYTFRFRSDNNNTLDELKNSYVYFQERKKLNDPFDAYPKLMHISKDKKELLKIYDNIKQYLRPNEKIEFEKSILKNDNDSFIKMLEDMLDKFISKLGIACFTCSPANHLMWSHYANFHKGICLQYNVAEDKEAFRGIKPMNYVVKFETKEYKPMTQENDFSHILYTKSEMWRNEFELRVVKENHGKVKINPNSLKKVIFGMETTNEFKQKVLRTTKNIYPDLTYYVSKPLVDKFGISIQQIII